MNFEDSWGRPWDARDLSSCTYLLVNFGQWPASRKIGAELWPANQYKLAVEAEASYLSSSDGKV